MGLFGSIFGKKVPPGGPAVELPTDEVVELRKQNLVLQKLVESLQAETPVIRSETPISTPTESSIIESAEQKSSEGPDSTLVATYSFDLEKRAQDTLPDAVREKMESVGSDLAISDRVLANLRIARALRQLLTERLISDLHDSKLQIVRLCDEAINFHREESSVLQVEAPTVVSIHDENKEISGEGIPEIRDTSFAPDLDEQKPAMQTSGVEEPEERSESDPQHQLIANKFETEAALLRGQLADVRRLLAFASGQLHDQKALQQRIDAAEIENSALKKGVGAEVWALKQKLELLNKEVASLNDQLRRRTVTHEQAERFSQREATINKNFAELQRREIELENAKSAKDDRTPKAISDLQLRVRTLQDQLSSSAVASQQRLADLQGQLGAADASVQHLLASKRELEKLLHIASRKNLGTHGEIKGLGISIRTLISLSDTKIVDWMLEQASPEQAEVNHGYLSLMGEGPWEKDELALLVEQMGFSLWQLPDPDVRHVVVGRTKWDAERLEAQIGCMVDLDLRIYSQEMWFAKLVTGRDPFDSGDWDLLMAFAKGHDALQYLIARDNAWPEVTTSGLVEGKGAVTQGDEIGSTSPLHNFGYEVGSKAGLSAPKRREILSRFLEARTLTFDENASDTYRLHWGRPRSVQRLFRIASHIQWLIGWQGKSPKRVQANEEWTDDLRWLKKTFYRPATHKFKWPNI
jgi:hypothetical protein